MVVGMIPRGASREENDLGGTKAALQAAKARGKQLGQPKGHVIPRAKGSAANAANAQSFAERLRPVLAELEDLSANAAAAELSRRGVATARGGKWTASLVLTVRRRLED